MNRCHWVNRTYFIFHLMRRLAAKPQIKPVDLGCESAENWQLPSTSTIACCYYYSAHKLILTVPSVYWSSYRPHPPSPVVIIAQRVSWYSLFVTVYSGCERWRSRACTGTATVHIHHRQLLLSLSAWADTHCLSLYTAVASVDAAERVLGPGACGTSSAGWLRRTLCRRSVDTHWPHQRHPTDSRPGHRRQCQYFTLLFCLFSYFCRVMHVQ